MKLRFIEGLLIESFQTGWLGLLISWILQLGLTWVISYLRLLAKLSNFQLERVPQEVIDFAFYHMVKDKTEEQIQTELASMGWNKKQDQEYVFDAVGAIYNLQELRKA